MVQFGSDMPDDGELDGCDVDFADHVTADEELDLLVLFAEALDPDSDKTVEQAKAEWEELFGAAP